MNPTPKLVAIMRQRRTEITIAARTEFGFVLDVLRPILCPEIESHECERMLQILCARHALALPPNWPKLFTRHCRTGVAQNAPFHAELPQVDRVAVTGVSSIARLLVGLRRSVRAGKREG